MATDKCIVWLWLNWMNVCTYNKKEWHPATKPLRSSSQSVTTIYFFFFIKFSSFVLFLNLITVLVAGWPGGEDPTAGGGQEQRGLLHRALGAEHQARQEAQARPRGSRQVRISYRLINDIYTRSFVYTDSGILLHLDYSIDIHYPD